MRKTARDFTRLNLIGKSFGKLTVKSFETKENNRSAWRCVCECGDEIVVRTGTLLDGKIVSCGCYGKNLLVQHNNPQEASFNSLWRMCPNNDLTKDQFKIISQMDCFYCGIAPSNKYNRYLNQDGSLKKDRTMTERVKKATIFYNGLDRLNSDLEHARTNVVPSCFMCNRSKLGRTIFEFIDYVNLITGFIQTFSMEEHKEQRKLIDATPLQTQNDLKKLIQRILKNERARYNDGDLTEEQFYQLSQLNCFYCGIKPINHRKKETVELFYNGLDRVDNKQKHLYSNCITSCKWCNYTKLDDDLEKFYTWIDRIRDYKHNWMHLPFNQGFCFADTINL